MEDINERFMELFNDEGLLQASEETVDEIRKLGTFTEIITERKGLVVKTINFVSADQSEVISIMQSYPKEIEKEVKLIELEAKLKYATDVEDYLEAKKLTETINEIRIENKGGTIIP